LALAVVVAAALDAVVVAAAVAVEVEAAVAVAAAPSFAADSDLPHAANIESKTKVTDVRMAGIIPQPR
jgi:hypothetical protein